MQANPGNFQARVGSKRLKGGGGVTLIFSYILRLGHFWGFKNLAFNIFGGFQKKNVFWGIKILWIFWGVITKFDYI